MTATAAPERSYGSPTGLSPRGEQASVVALLVGYLVCFALLGVEIGNAFGLPAHPLFVHVPVILVPALVIATVAVVVRPAWRERYGFLWGGLAVASLAGTVLSASAGEKFLEQKPVVSSVLNEHREAGETLRTLLFIFVAVVIAIVIRDWLGRRGDGPIGGKEIGVALSIVALLLAGASGFFVIRAGHLGSKSVWHERGAGGGGEPDEDGG